MKSSVLTVALGLAVFSLVQPALAKLPPLNDEAKAKAAEAAAKSAHGAKVEAFLLCKWQDKVAAQYAAKTKAEGKEVKPPVATPACADPGAFVYVPAGAASAPAAPAAVAPAAPAPADKDKKKS